MRKLIAVLLVLLATIVSSIGGFAISASQTYTPLAGQGATPASNTSSGPAPMTVSDTEKWRFKRDGAGAIVPNDKKRDLMVQKEDVSRPQLTHSSTEQSQLEQDQDNIALVEGAPRNSTCQSPGHPDQVIIAKTAPSDSFEELQVDASSCFQTTDSPSENKGIKVASEEFADGTPPGKLCTEVFNKFQ